MGIERIRRHASDRFLRGSVGVITAFSTTQFFGFVFWLIAARRFAPEAVGVITAAGSAMTLSALAIMAGLPPYLLRSLPASGPKATRRAYLSLCWAFLCAVVVASAFVLIVPQSSPVVAALIVLGAGFSGLAFVGDAIAIAGRATRLVAIRGLIASAGKTILIFAPFPLLGLPLGVSTGLMAWVLAMGLSALWIIWGARGPLRLLLGLPEQALPTPKTTIITNHLSVVGQQLPILALPLIAALTLGTTAAGLFYVPWFIGAALFGLPTLIAGVLLAEGSRTTSDVRALTRRALLLYSFALLPVVLVVAAAAPWILTIFGSEYVAGAALLSLVALSTIPACVTALALSLWRINHQVTRCAILTFSSGLVSTVALAALLSSVGNFPMAGAAWLLLQSLTALIALPTLIRTLRQGPPPPQQMGATT